MLRIFFQKRDRAKYISHLDLVRCLTRAFARTDLPIWFTEGFNPHIYMSFALPLPLGYTGREESFDVRVTEDDYDPQMVTDKLGTVLPPDLRIIFTASPIKGPEAIAWADYALTLTPAGNAEELERALREFLSRPEILAEKTTKRGTREIDIAPHLRLLRLETAGNLVEVTLRLAAGNALNVNPNLVLGAFAKEKGPLIDAQEVERAAILDENFALFR